MVPSPDEEETWDDLYAEVWRRLDFGSPGPVEFQRRRRQAEALYEELGRLSPEEQVRRFGEERFQDFGLLDLLLEECHASQLSCS